MDVKEALQTAARRYCLERAPDLDPRRQLPCPERQSAYLRSVDQGGDARKRSVQEVLLGPILRDIERIVPETYPTVTSLRADLVRIVESTPVADNEYYPWWWSDDERRQAQEERRAFSAYIQDLSLEDLKRVRALPYFRVCSPREADVVASAISEHWGHIPEHYYEWETDAAGLLPPPAANVTRFDLCDFAEHVSVEWLREALRDHGVNRLWELRELPRELFELDLAMFVPRRDGTELYWTSGSMDWIMYSSHEGGLAVGGAWLERAVKDIWPNWRQGLEAGACTE